MLPCQKTVIIVVLLDQLNNIPCRKSLEGGNSRLGHWGGDCLVDPLFFVPLWSLNKDIYGGRKLLISNHCLNPNLTYLKLITINYFLLSRNRVTLMNINVHSILHKAYINDHNYDHVVLYYAHNRLHSFLTMHILCA